MPPKKDEGPVKKVLLGRPSNNVKMGIVGLPNVGKSTFFNLLCNMHVAAENYPFCTVSGPAGLVASLHFCISYVRPALLMVCRLIQMYLR